MSNHVTMLLRNRNLGLNLTLKSVLLLMADYASDDGTGIWASKSRMARELETTDRTIQRAIKELTQQNLLTEVGKIKCSNGATIEYNIVIKNVDKFPLTISSRPVKANLLSQEVVPDTVRPPTDRHPTPDTQSPHGATDSHPNLKEPSLNPIVAVVREGEDEDEEPVNCDVLLRNVLAAVGLQQGSLPIHWLPPASTIHVSRWQTQLGLTSREIIVAAKSSRAQHEQPPNGPKALDRVMQALAGQKSAQPLTPKRKLISGGRDERTRQSNAIIDEIATRLGDGRIKHDPYMKHHDHIRRRAAGR